MQTRTSNLKPIPNPRGNQTQPAPKPTLPRTGNGRFTPEFRPNPPLTPTPARI
jgi:hypothetical protein